MALVDGFVVFDGGDRLIEAAGVLEHAALLAGGLVVGVFRLANVPMFPFRTPVRSVQPLPLFVLECA